MHHPGMNDLLLDFPLNDYENRLNNEESERSSSNSENLESLLVALGIEGILEISVFTIFILFWQDCPMLNSLFVGFLSLLFLSVAGKSYGCYCLITRPDQDDMSELFYLLLATLDIIFALFYFYSLKSYGPDPCGMTFAFNPEAPLSLGLLLVIYYGYYIVIKAMILLLFAILFLLAIIGFGVMPRRLWVPLQGNLFDRLLKGKYDPKQFKVAKECPICLLPYAQDQELTILPCDPRHFFHSECISQWLQNNASCPLCKAPVTEEAISHGKNYQEVIKFLKTLSPNSSKMENEDQESPDLPSSGSYVPPIIPEEGVQERKCSRSD